MSTFALNSDNDFYFKNNRLVIIEDNNTDAEIKQRVAMRLKFFKDEWFLNSEHGLPYFQEILGNKNLDFNIVESIIKEQILEVEGVKEIIESSIDYDQKAREFKYMVNIISINNTIITDNLFVF